MDLRDRIDAVLLRFTTEPAIARAARNGADYIDVTRVEDVSDALYLLEQPEGWDDAEEAAFLQWATELSNRASAEFVPLPPDVRVGARR